jgi:hypothetical protein
MRARPTGRRKEERSYGCGILDKEIRYYYYPRILLIE